MTAPRSARGQRRPHNETFNEVARLAFSLVVALIFGPVVLGYLVAGDLAGAAIAAGLALVLAGLLAPRPE